LIRAHFHGRNWGIEKEMETISKSPYFWPSRFLHLQQPSRWVFLSAARVKRPVVPNSGERFGRFSERTPSSHINHEKHFNHKQQNTNPVKQEQQHIQQ